MASKQVSDYLLERLREWGVDNVFAYPGDGINGIDAAWARADNKPKFIQPATRRWPPSRPWATPSSAAA